MKYLLSFNLLLFSCYSFADMPGNKPRPDCNVVVNGMQNNPDYSFYKQIDDEPESKLGNGDTIYVPGGSGKPQFLNIWATNKQTKKNTDTLSFFNSEDEETVTLNLIINTDNHLVDKDAVKADTSGNVSYASNLNNIGNKDDETKIKNNKIMYLISGLSFIILIALVFFVWNKNKKSKPQKPV